MYRNLLLLTLSLLSSAVAMEEQPRLSSAPAHSVQNEEPSFHKIKELYEEYQNEASDKKKQIKIQIISMLNALLKMGEITEDDREEAIKIAKDIDAGTLAVRLGEADLSNIGTLVTVPIELTDYILEMLSNGQTLEQLKEMLTVSKGFNKLLFRAPIHLNLSSKKISAPNLEKIFSLFPGTVSLNLNGCQIGDLGAKAIGNSKFLTNLQTLSLWDNNIGDEGAAALANSPSLKSLQTLTLLKNHIGDPGAAAIANSPNLKSLQTLNLGWNNIGDPGAAAIANSPTLISLPALHLGRNHIGDAGAAAIANSPNLKSLQTLSLWGNNIGDPGAAAIANSPNLKSLQTLYLSNNRIGNEGVKVIANSKVLTNLQNLYLERNQIGDAGAAAIANSKVLANLESLHLNGNQIGGAGRESVEAKFPFARF